MIIKGASVFCEDGTFQVKDVFVEDHKIVATEAEVSDKTVVDANGYKLIPGLVDVHSHGACGHDFCDCDVEGVKEILRFEKAHGITSYCPTSMTLSKEMLVDILRPQKKQTASQTEHVSLVSIWKDHLSHRRKREHRMVLIFRHRPQRRSVHASRQAAD